MKNNWIPPVIEEMMIEALAQLGTDLSQSSDLSRCVHQLSDFYIKHPQAPTPWSEPWAQKALWSYFFPLNFLRNQKVMAEGNRLKFFTAVDEVVDYGAGPGTASAAYLLMNPKPHTSMVWVEKFPLAKNWAQHFQKFFPANIQLQSQWPSTSRPRKRCGLFSYVLTELHELPSLVKDFDQLVIVEPSTHQDARRLQDQRKKLVSMGFSLWAPCLHEEECPLLKHSPRDWCHDRLVIDRPPWLQALEAELPWKNQSITMSFLLASRTAPPWKNHRDPHQGRLVGDALEEKGKTRQMVCTNEERIFLSWLHRPSPPPVFPRGALVQWSSEAQKLALEIRPGSQCKEISTPSGKSYQD